MLRILALVFVISYMTISGGAQGPSPSHQTSQKFIGIGEAAPNIKLPLIMNFVRPNGSLSDFKGKLLILDFWATYCSPCVSSMPKMYELQKRFNGKAQILLIGAENRLTAQKFFARRPQIKLPNALSVYGTLAQRFGIPGVGTYVWIDAHGSVFAVTDHDQVTAENIEAVLDGKRPILPSIVGYGRKSDFDVMSPFLIDGNGYGSTDLQYHSVISGVFRGGPGLLVLDRTNGPYKNRRIFARNYRILDLYRVAFGDKSPWRRDFSNVRTLLDVTDKSRFEGYAPELVYCYELIVPADRADQLHNMMRQDLDRYFGSAGRVEKRTVKALVLSRLPNQTVAVSRIEPMATNLIAAGFPQGEGQLRIPNLPYYTLQSLLEHLFSLPVVDETGLEGTVDLGLAYSELFAEKKKADAAFIRTALAKYGITLDAAEREVEFLVIRETRRK